MDSLLAGWLRPRLEAMVLRIRLPASKLADAVMAPAQEALAERAAGHEADAQFR